MKKIKNAVPKRYRAFFIEPGLADYTTEGIGVVLVGKQCLDKMMSTFVGMPVVNFEHTDKEPEELFNLSDDEKGEMADGTISDVGYDEKSGWYYADMMIWNKETQDNIDKNGYSVSCAYDVLKTDTTGGTYHNVPYDEEVLDGNYVHMAVVPNPRYEKAWIIKNSNSQEGSVKIKLFKKKPLKNEAPKEPEVEEEVVENAESGVIELEDGTQIPVAEAIEMYKAKKSEELENAGQVLDMEDEIEIDGEKVSVKELMAACGKGDAMENAEPAQDDDAEPVVDEQRQNSTPKSKKVNKQVKNAAGKDVDTPVRNLNTASSRLDRGKSRYGSKVEQGGK